MKGVVFAMSLDIYKGTLCLLENCVCSDSYRHTKMHETMIIHEFNPACANDLSGQRVDDHSRVYANFRDEHSRFHRGAG